MRGIHAIIVPLVLVFVCVIFVSSTCADIPMPARVEVENIWLATVCPVAQTEWREVKDVYVAGQTVDNVYIVGNYRVAAFLTGIGEWGENVVVIEDRENSDFNIKLVGSVDESLLNELVVVYGRFSPSNYIRPVPGGYPEWWIIFTILSVVVVVTLVGVLIRGIRRRQ